MAGMRIDFIANSSKRQTSTRHSSTRLVALAVFATISASAAAGAPPSTTPTPTSPKSAPAGDSRPLTISAVPVESADVQKGVFDLLTKALSNKLAREVKFVQYDTHAELIDALAAGKLDVALVGAVCVVEVKQKAAVVPILRAIRNGQSTCRGAIIVRGDSSIKSVADLKKKRLAFVDEHSTAGYHLPVKMLASAGLHPGKDFEQVFSRSEFAVADAVVQGTVDAGACTEGCEELLTDPKRLRVVAFTDRAPSDALVVREALGPALIGQLKTMFQELPTYPEGADFLMFAGIDKFVPATAKDYENLGVGKGEAH